MTLGVRAIVEDDEGRIILVRHTYVKGWFLPGGGVETGETLEQAIEKELREEVNVRIASRPRLISMHKNPNASKRDHVAMFHIDEWTQTAMPEPNREIAECRWVPKHDLPPGTTRGTRARISEYLEDKPPDPLW